MIVILALVLLLSLALIPIGLPGIWLMVIAGFAFLWLSPTAPFGLMLLIACTGIAIVAEILEFVLAAQYTKKFGGSSRGAWGAVFGGIVGAIVGVPVPIVGPIIGAFFGSFVGALVGEFSVGASADGATRAATGATIGRAIAMALKVVAGCVIAALLLTAAFI